MLWLQENFVKIAKQASQLRCMILASTKQIIIIMTYADNEEICAPNDDFSHTTHNTLALQYSGNPKITG